MTHSLSKQHPLNRIEIEPIRKQAFTLYSHAGTFDISWHTHPQHQLVYAENGVVHIKTEQRAFLLPARHGAWIPAHCPHGLHSDTSMLQLWALYFREREPEHDLLCQLNIFAISSLAREMILFTNRWPIEDRELELERSFFETIRLLAIEWCNQPWPLVLPIVAGQTHFEEVTKYIRKNLGEQLSIDMVSARHAMSRRTIMRQFQKHLGMTFGEYLRIARMVKAVELLTQSDTTVTDIAYAVGYQSLSSFIHAFRQMLGLTPSEYMRGLKHSQNARPT